MGIGDEMKKRGLQLLSDPRVTKLMQNEQFIRAMLAALQVPGKVNEFTQEQSARLASLLGLTTEQRVHELERRLEALEVEVESLRQSPKRGPAGVQ